MSKKGDMFYAWTTDAAIAEKAELGGAVTGLMKFMLEKKVVDAVFAVKKGQDIYDAVPTLVTDPKVLLLDEPTEGIQPSIIKDIARALNEIRRLKGLSIVVSEQVLSFAMDVADRLFVIEGGRLVHETERDKTDAAHIKSYLSV